MSTPTEIENKKYRNNIKRTEQQYKKDLKKLNNTHSLRVEKQEKNHERAIERIRINEILEDPEHEEYTKFKKEQVAEEQKKLDFRINMIQIHINKYNNERTIYMEKFNIDKINTTVKDITIIDIKLNILNEYLEEVTSGKILYFGNSEPFEYITINDGWIPRSFHREIRTSLILSNHPDYEETKKSNKKMLLELALCKQ
jgi:hypothetical protein